MQTKRITLELPAAMLERINAISEESKIFENDKDVIIHAITDIIEKYNRN